MESDNLAIVPVRTGSKRLANKNLLDFFGKPMFIHTVEAARAAGLFSDVHVSTESPEVAEICEANDLEVRFLRDEELANDDASLESVCTFVLDTYRTLYDTEYDNFCLLWATAPLRTSEDITNAYELLSEDTDAVVSATTYDLPVFCAQEVDSEGFLVPRFPEMFWLPGQRMPPVFCDNGALCWVRVDAFRKEGTWMPRKTKPYMMEKARSVDIDTAEDLEMAKYRYNQLSNKRD